jgi:hypothetical protein
VITFLSADAKLEPSMASDGESPKPTFKFLWAEEQMPSERFVGIDRFRHVPKAPILTMNAKNPILP